MIFPVARKTNDNRALGADCIGVPVFGCSLGTRWAFEEAAGRVGLSEASRHVAIFDKALRQPRRLALCRPVTTRAGHSDRPALASVLSLPLAAGDAPHGPSSSPRIDGISRVISLMRFANRNGDSGVTLLSTRVDDIEDSHEQRIAARRSAPKNRLENHRADRQALERKSREGAAERWASA